MRYQQPLVHVDAVARAGSIRKAADNLSISSTALNRRILAIESEVGAPLFERLPGGVRLSAAGEVFIHFARRELAEAARMREQVAELAGETRGHIALACGQTLLQATLSELLTRYRRDHPRVTVALRVVANFEVAAALENLDADLVLMLSPETSANIEVVASVEQTVHVVCRKDHPLLAQAGPVRLDDCYDYPMALPTRGHGVRDLLEQRATELSRELPVLLQSDSAEMISSQLIQDWSISFGVPAGQAQHGNTGGALTSRNVDERDISPATLSVLQLRGRTLPVAAAHFADQLINTLKGAPAC